MELAPVGEGNSPPCKQTMQTTVAFRGARTDIARARHLAACFLSRGSEEQGRAVSQRTVDVTQVVVSELVTNAYKYAPGPLVMDLRIIGASVVVVVWDSNPALPVVQSKDPGRVGQHGMEMVIAAAQHVGFQLELVGKSVTVGIALLDPADHT
ncbi:ATP-binding protein [Streptomyces parvulus]|uniref:ATP-binding protein n=1 Tax=Streptomyces parvulus TaxID=146923 RepID=A0ABV5D8R4_9ACTN